VNDDLHIRFASDVPPMVVDVVAPDFSVVKRLMMSADREEVVSVPSEDTFLRVHLPSGRSVSLTDPGNMTRLVTLNSIWLGDGRRVATSDAPEEPTLPPFSTPARGTTFEAAHRSNERNRTAPPANFESRRELRDHHVWRAWTPPNQDYVDMQASLGDCQVWIEDAATRHIAAAGTIDGREASWTVAGMPTDPPYGLRLVGPELEMSIRIPANVRRVWARVDRRSRERSLVYSFRLESIQPACDTILNYLRRGDFSAATAMEEWVERSEELLFGKFDDPYAAAVGGYLLLKLERFDVLRTWAKNLADNFSELPDGCVIWASQLAQQEPARLAEIRAYYAMALERGIPVYTEGLRLLIDGLRLLGPNGEALRSDLRAMLGEVLWKSPVSAGVSSSSGRSSSGSISFDIEFGSRA
jgi:hypothetical protein